jgi:hypothetical protein
MLFKPYKSSAIVGMFFDIYFLTGVVLALIALSGFFSGAGLMASLAGVFYIILVSFLSLNERFRKNNFSILLCFFSLLYLNIPTAFVLVQGSDYLFGDGLASVPFSQEEYHESLALCFVYLSVLWFSIWLGIVFAGTRVREFDNAYFSSIRVLDILILGSAVLVITWLDNQGIADVRLEGADKVNSLLAFVFFDHAYLVMVGLILIFKLNDVTDHLIANRYSMLAFVVFVAFVTLSFVSGSKGAILVVFVLYILLPCAYFREFPRSLISFPTPWLIVFLLIIALPLFYFALIQRVSLASGVAPDYGTLLAGIVSFDGDVFSDLVNHVFYRLSWGGLDRFMLIVQSFYVEGYDLETATAFVDYLAKNTLNLILPGTPYPAYYAPSSQLFPQVIWKNLAGGAQDVNSLIMSFNTQPYTIFGVFIVSMGPLTPFVLFLSAFMVVFIYNGVKHPFLKISFVYFVHGALSSYGLEAAFGNSVHLFVSIVLMYFILKTLAFLDIGRAFAIAVKSGYVRSPFAR